MPIDRRRTTVVGWRGFIHFPWRLRLSWMASMKSLTEGFAQSQFLAVCAAAGA
jgi:hypothetical protein